VRSRRARATGCGGFAKTLGFAMVVSTSMPRDPHQIYPDRCTTAGFSLWRAPLCHMRAERLPARGVTRRQTGAAPRHHTYTAARPVAAGALSTAQRYYASQPLYRLSPDGSVVTLPPIGGPGRHCGRANQAGSIMSAHADTSVLAAAADRIKVQFLVPHYVTRFAG
jgi:hypothetical protein